MSIRKGLQLVLALCVAYLIVSSLLVTRFLWFPLVDQYEEGLADRRTEERRLFFQKIFERVGALSRDYARWELSCEYMGNATMRGNEPEIESYDPELLGVDFMAYVGEDGEVIVSKSVANAFPDESSLNDLYSSIVAAVPPGQCGISGSLFHESIPVYVAAEAITDGRDGSRCVGYVIVGDLLREIAVEIFASTAEDDERGPATRWSFSEASFLPPASPENYYTLLERHLKFESLPGLEPGVSLSITQEHTLLRLLKQLHTFGFAITLLAWLMMAGLVYWFVNRYVLRSLAETAMEARTLARDENNRRVLRAHATLEVDNLVESFNSLLRQRQSVLEALTVREGQTAELFENALDGIINVDQSGRVQQVNSKAATMFGYTREDIVEMQVDDLFASKEDALRFRAGLDELASGHTSDFLGRLVEFELRRCSGEVFPAETSVVLTSDGTGERCYAVFMRDIAERRLFIDRLIDSQKFEVLGQLTGQMAHDFNNILGVTLANIQLVEMESSLDSESAARLNDAQRACWKGASLIRKLLAVARRQETHREHFSLQAALDEMVPLLRSSVGEGIDFQVLVPEEDYQVFADRSGFESCLLNLVANARDAFDRPGRITVRVSAARREGAGAVVCLSVSDNGRGMPRNVLKRAFEPFFTTKPLGKGTGLGLAMVQAFAQESEGQVNIESRPGMGSTVTIELPQVRTTPHVTLGGDVPLLPRGEGERILVVDDQDGIRASVVEMLRRLGYQALSVDSAESAIHQLETVESDHDSGPPVELVLTDVIMPGSSGLELKAIIAERWPELPVIFMTGFSDGQLEDEGIREYERILKPFGVKQLAGFVHQHIRTPILKAVDSR